MCLYRSQSCQSEMAGKYCGSVVVLLCHGEVHTQFLTQRPTALIGSVEGCIWLCEVNNRLVDYWYDCFLLSPLDSALTHPSIQCCVTCADEEVPKLHLHVTVWLWCPVECLCVPKYVLAAELQSYSVSNGHNPSDIYNGKPFTSNMMYWCMRSHHQNTQLRYIELFNCDWNLLMAAVGRNM